MQQRTLQFDADRSFCFFQIVGEYEYFTRFHTMDPFQSVARGKLAFKSGKEEQGQSTVKFPEDKNTMIYLRADLVIKS